MSVTVELGEEGLSVEIPTVDDLEKMLDKHHDRLGELFLFRNEVPQEIVGSKAVLAGGPTYTYIDCGGPRPGWLWDVMRLLVSGSDPFTAIAGASAIAFIAGAAPVDSATEEIGKFSNIFLTQAAVPGTGLPATFGRQVVIVRPGQHVIVGVKGAAAGTQINVHGGGIQYRDPSAGLPINTVRRPR